MKVVRIIAFITLIASLSSCNGCGAKVSSIDAESSSAALDQVTEKLNILNIKIQQESDKAVLATLLLDGYTLAKESTQPDRAVSYAVAYLKQEPDGIQSKEMLRFVGETMYQGENKEAGQIILQGLVDRYASDPSMEPAKDLLAEPISDTDAFIRTIAESVFENADQYGINTANAQKYVDVCEAYGLAYADNPKAPEYLYKASEIAVAIRTFPKALSIYDWLIYSYPDYKKTPNALFAKGYLLDEELKQREQAKVSFQQFIDTYPEHELADDAMFLLENIGKSGEEIIKIIEANKNKKVSE